MAIALVNKSSKFLLEKLIILGKGKREGQLLWLVGGAASGKGFARANFIENDKLFPEKCNVTLAKIINENHIKVKVWERGAGLTKACGTAACAAAVAGNINGFTKTKTDIEFEFGKLSIFFDDKNSIHMKGPVSEIKEIDIKL